MSVWGILRSKRMWIAVGCSVAVLLVFWALGAMLIEKGALPLGSQSGWIAAGFLLAGVIGGFLAGGIKGGSMTSALLLALVLILLDLIAASVIFGGISLGNGGWKGMLFFTIGCLLAAFAAAGKSGKRRRKGGKAVKMKPIKRR